MAVKLRAGTVAARSQLDIRDLLQAYQLPHFSRANNDIAKGVGFIQPPQSVDGQRLLLAVKHWRRTDLPRSPLHVLLAQRL
ncbi:hypothetical protein D3C80_1350290 [compost metagenome]